jgi:hypothetical protein
MTPPTKPRLEGFEFLEHLGAGKFGQVWKAWDVKLKVFRAIKVLAKERFRECDAQRLLEEAQTQALPGGDWRALVLAIPHRSPRRSGHGVPFSPESGELPLGFTGISDHRPPAPDRG